MLCALSVLASCPRVHAQDAATTTASTSVYVRSDTDETTVITPSANLSAAVTENTRVDLMYMVDVWSSASVDIVAAASKNVTEQRSEIDVAVQQVLTDVTFGGSYRYSTEYDYVSHGGSLGGSYDFADNNATISVVARAAFDEVWAAGSEDLSEPAMTVSLRTSFTQVIDAMTLVQGTYEIGRQEGYLSSPYRYVRIANTASSAATTCLFPIDMCLLEKSPDTRWKHAVAVRGRRALGDALSLGAGYRFYLDDWELISHTADFDVSWVPTEDLLVSLSYRFYMQGKAFHWKTHYPAAEMAAFYTSDKELSLMTSHRIGLELSRDWSLDDLGSKLHTILLAAPIFYSYPDHPRVSEITAFETTLSVGVEL